MDYTNLIQNILIYALPVLLAITMYEEARGYTARYFGDNTASSMGLLSSNPLKYIDPIGTILIPLILVLTGSPFLFGYGKSLPIRYGNLRQPKKHMVWVALSGPIANFVMAVMWGVVFTLLRAFEVDEPFFLKMAQGGLIINLAMFAFTLFPVPPLAGGHILIGLLPYKQAEILSRIEPWGFFVVMGLVITGIIGKLWMIPITTIATGLVGLILSPLAFLLK
jgi:Zn-dependent protease